MITMNNSAPPLVAKAELESLRHLLAILSDPEKTKRRLEELTAAAEGLKAQMAAHEESHDKMAAALAEHRKQLQAAKAEADAAIAADRERHLAECAAREQAVLKKEQDVAETAAKLNAHLAEMQSGLAQRRPPAA
jgi:hypothetical protein